MTSGFSFGSAIFLTADSNQLNFNWDLINILVCFQIIKLVMAVSLYMKKIYEEVGSKSDAEPEGKLTIEKNLHLLRDEVAFLIEEVLEEHPLPYQLKDFQ